MSDAVAVLDPVGHPEVLFVCPQNALEEFFGTDRVPLTVTSTVTGTTRHFARLRDVRREVTGGHHDDDD